MWDVASHTPLSEPLLRHNGRITDLIFSQDGKFLISSSLDNQVQLWDVATQTALGTVQHQKGHVKALQIDPNGGFLFTGGSDGNIMVWDIGQSTQNPPQAFPPTAAHDGAVSAFLLVDGGQTLLSGGWDSTVKSWHFSQESGFTPKQIEHHTAAFVNDLAVSQSETVAPGFAAVGRDGSLFWQPADTNVAGTTFTLGHSDWAEAVLFHDGFYSAGQDGKLIWHPIVAVTALPSVLLAERPAPIWDLAFDTQANLLYAAENDHQVSVWLPLSHPLVAQRIRPYAHQIPFPDNINSVAFLDENRLAVGMENGTVAQIHDWAEAEKVFCCEAGNGLPKGTATLADGQEIETGSVDGRIFITASGDRVTLFTDGNESAQLTLPQPASTLQLNLHNSALAIGLADGSVLVVAIDSGNFGKVIAHWTGHTEPVISLAFSPNGRLLASGSWDSTLRLWEIESGQFMQLDGHERGVAALDFSQDGQFLASGSWDDTVIIWNLSAASWRMPAKGYLAPFGE